MTAFADGFKGLMDLLHGSIIKNNVKRLSSKLRKSTLTRFSVQFFPLLSIKPTDSVSFSGESFTLDDVLSKCVAKFGLSELHSFCLKKHSILFQLDQPSGFSMEHLSDGDVLYLQPRPQVTADAMVELLRSVEMSEVKRGLFLACELLNDPVLAETFAVREGLTVVLSLLELESLPSICQDHALSCLYFSLNTPYGMACVADDEKISACLIPLLYSRILELSGNLLAAVSSLLIVVACAGNTKGYKMLKQAARSEKLRFACFVRVAQNNDPDIALAGINLIGFVISSCEKDERKPVIVTLQENGLSNVLNKGDKDSVAMRKAKIGSEPFLMCLLIVNVL